MLDLLSFFVDVNCNNILLKLDARVLVNQLFFTSIFKFAPTNADTFLFIVAPQCGRCTDEECGV